MQEQPRKSIKFNEIYGANARFFLFLSLYSIITDKRMKVINLIKSSEKTAFSFEILPPLKGTGIEKVYETIDLLREFDPKYINITTHRSEYVLHRTG